MKPRMETEGHLIEMSEKESPVPALTFNNMSPGEYISPRVWASFLSYEEIGLDLTISIRET